MVSLPLLRRLYTHVSELFGIGQNGSSCDERLFLLGACLLAGCRARPDLSAGIPGGEASGKSLVRSEAVKQKSE